MVSPSISPIRWQMSLLALQIALTFTRAPVNGESIISPPALELGVLEWIHNAEGGYFNPKQELRRIEGSTQSSAGIFAAETIEKGEVLMQVPSDLIIKSHLEEEGQMCCGTVEAVLKEMKLGEESKYHPYVMYLRSQPHDDLPSAWSEKGKELLYEIVGEERGKDPRTSGFDCIPPEEPIEWCVRTSPSN